MSVFGPVNLRTVYWRGGIYWHGCMWLEGRRDGTRKPRKGADIFALFSRFLNFNSFSNFSFPDPANFLFVVCAYDFLSVCPGNIMRQRFRRLGFPLDFSYCQLLPFVVCKTVSEERGMIFPNRNRKGYLNCRCFFYPSPLLLLLLLFYWKFFTPALADDFLLDFEWFQVSSSPQGLFLVFQLISATL